MTIFGGQQRPIRYDDLSTVTPSEPAIRERAWWALAGVASVSVMVFGWFRCEARQINADDVTAAWLALSLVAVWCAARRSRACAAAFVIGCVAAWVAYCALVVVLLTASGGIEF